MSAYSSDSEYEEEEIIVFADFKNNLTLQHLREANSVIKFIGIDSDNPIADINGNLFKGKYDFSMGTHVFFEEVDSPITVDQIYEKYPKKSFKYLNKTNKVLHFSRIFVEPEKFDTELTTKGESNNQHEENNCLYVDTTYEEALQQLKPKEN